MEQNISMSYKTRDGSGPQGKSKVYFSYHPEDFGYFEHIAELILDKLDCAIYYYDYGKNGRPQLSALARQLDEMQLIVIPVTEKYLSQPSIAYAFELRYAVEKPIEVLPLLQNSALAEPFKQKCRNMPYLDENAQTDFDRKLESFLSDSMMIASQSSFLMNLMMRNVGPTGNTPEQNYREGLRYLDNADGERDPKRAMQLIGSAAEAGLPEAMEKLAEIYHSENDIFMAVLWQERYVARLDETYKQNGDIAAAVALFWGRARLIDYYVEAPETADAIRICYEENLALIVRISEHDPEKYTIYQATSYANAAFFYSNLGETAQSDAYLSKALLLLEKLAAENPEKYLGELALTYRNAGVHYYSRRDFKGSGEFIRKAITIYASLSEGDFEKYGNDLAISYSNLAVLFAAQGNIEEARSYFQKTAELRFDLYDKDHSRYAKPLADTLNNLAMLCRTEGDLAGALHFMGLARQVLGSI